MKIGFLHPGSMGVSIAAAALSSGHEALWASSGRSATTLERAAIHGLTDVSTVGEVCAQSDIICSICPPASAQDVARTVREAGFKGIYVDGNAISPERMAEVAEIVTSGGARVVDGAIIGNPAWKAGTTSLHLSGPERQMVADCFSGSFVTAVTLSERVGEASALKMCYAALTKGTAALLCGIIATAEELGVRDALYARWEADAEGRVGEREATVLAATGKAWRWVDEMNEIAKTFEGAGQPGGFHLASAEVFTRLSGLKDQASTVSIDEIIAALLVKK